ncbi:hypothetical protein DL240_07385 [Lujinxingia litoralis]|uniref:Lipoprotein n=1 Tax=Lujinxingia litoralis TaxID=2211119 RepID=A0A328C832_9DELT|nr:hypothetical protein [Lujinxingia litoralis]RAL23963.1 hypothetical protein DL240_07385 [Lujinxingia litoralis]
MNAYPRVWPLLPLSLALLIACGESEPTLVSYEDEGEVCLNRSLQADDAPLQEGAPLSVRVELPVCLSSSCTSAPVTSCELSLEDHTITLSSHASYLDTSQPLGSCTADCGLLFAECELPALAAGQYTLIHGEHTYTFAIPSEPVGCLEPTAD